MATCSKCGREHDRIRNRKTLTPASYCHRCHSRYMRKKHRPHIHQLVKLGRKLLNVELATQTEQSS